MSLPAWHPLIVHFPLALTVTATGALVAARIAPAGRISVSLSLVGTWNLLAGAIGAVFALGSGLAALIGQSLSPAARAAVASHAKWAMLSVFALLALAVWRGAGAAFDSRPSRSFLAALLLATAALVVTGYLGGENVYHYGVGVAAVAR